MGPLQQETRLKETLRVGRHLGRSRNQIISQGSTFAKLLKIPVDISDSAGDRTPANVPPGKHDRGIWEWLTMRSLAIYAVVAGYDAFLPRRDVCWKLNHVHGYLFLSLLMRRLKHRQPDDTGTNRVCGSRVIPQGSDRLQFLRYDRRTGEPKSIYPDAFVLGAGVSGHGPSVNHRLRDA